MKHAALREHLSSVAELLRDNDAMAKQITTASTVQVALAEKCQNMAAALEAMKGAIAESKVQRSEWAIRLADAAGIIPHSDERSEDLFHRCCEELLEARAAVEDAIRPPEAPYITAVPGLDNDGNPIF